MIRAPPQEMHLSWPKTPLDQSKNHLKLLENQARPAKTMSKSRQNGEQL